MAMSNRLGCNIRPLLGQGIAKSGSAARPYSTRPPWLQSLLERQGSAPKLYAWSPANMGNGLGDQSGSSLPTNGHGQGDGRVHVVGVGNLGRLYASCIRKHPDSPPVTLVVRRKELLLEWIGSNGIEITRSGVVDADKSFDIEWWTEECPNQGPIREVANGKTLQHLIVGTKASGAMPEVDRLRRYLDGSSAVAFLQNGMSKLWPPHGKEYVARRYAPGQEPSFFACINNHGAFSEGLFKSVHASPADVAMGAVLLNDSSISALAPSASYLVKLLTTAPHLNARFVSRADAWVLQLQKLVANCVINPLTAILRCKNGVLFEDEHGPVSQIIDKLLAEASSILQAIIYHESSAEILLPSPQPTNLNSGADRETLASLRKSLALRFSQPEMRRNLYKYGQVIKDNNSSMLQDVRAGKPTEIRDFNGWLVDTATMLNQEPRTNDNARILDVSTHERLIDLVEAQSVMDSSELARRLLPWMTLDRHGPAHLGDEPVREQSTLMSL